MSLHLSSLKGPVFEIHYWVDDKSHTMDAIVQNKCESEILDLIKSLAANFGEEIQIETEGDEEIKELNILRVDEYHDNNRPIETHEGNKVKKEK